MADSDKIPPDIGFSGHEGFPGHEDEFIRLFSKSQCSLHAFITGLTYSASDADDVLQEVNLALWRKRHSFDPQYDFLRWAFGFARVEMANQRRKYGKSRLLFSDDVLNTLADEWPTHASHHEERLAALAFCVKKLGDVERRFIAEFYRAGSTVNELSKLHGKPASSIYKILDRARKSLRLCIQKRVSQTGHPT